MTTVNIQKIIYFTTMKFSDQYHDAPERHDFWEMVYLESGEAIVTAGKKQIHLLPGEVIFHKPGETHCIQAIGSNTTQPFFISFYSTSKIMNLFEGLKLSLDSEGKRLIYKIYDEARNIFSRKHKVYDKYGFSAMDLLPNSPLGAQQLYKIYLEELLILIAREIERKEKLIMYNSKEEFEKGLYQKMIEFISQRVYSDMSIKDLCTYLNYGRTYISAIFKKFSGVSIIQYYNSLKIKESKKLIKSKKYSISEISDMLKFNSPYYFSNVFKKFENMSPSEYANKKKMS
jgi:AraC-like DNA-binding protein